MPVSTTVVELTEELQRNSQEAAIYGELVRLLSDAYLPRDSRPPLRTLTTSDGVTVSAGAIRDVVAQMRAEQMKRESEATNMKLMVVVPNV